MQVQKWWVLGLLWLLQSCATAPTPDKKTLSYGLIYLGDSPDVSMRTIVTGEARTEQEPSRLPRTPLAQLKRGNLTLILSATDNLTCLATLQSNFTAESLATMILPELLSKPLQGHYELELVLLPPANMDVNQITRLPNPALQFFTPFDCHNSSTIQEVTTVALPMLFHELAHLESFLIWPDGWELQPRLGFWLGFGLTTDQQISILATEIVASQFQLCTALLTPAINGAQLSVSVPAQLKNTELYAAVIRQELSEPGPKEKSDRRTAIGALLAKLQLNALLGDSYNAHNPAQKQQLEHFCRQVLTADNIQQQLDLLTPHRHLL